MTADLARFRGLEAGDIVIARTRGAMTKMRIDGFVADAMGDIHVALSDPASGKGIGTLRIGQVKFISKGA